MHHSYLFSQDQVGADPPSVRCCRCGRECCETARRAPVCAPACTSRSGPTWRRGPAACCAPRRRPQRAHRRSNAGHARRRENTAQPAREHLIPPLSCEVVRSVSYHPVLVEPQAAPSQPAQVGLASACSALRARSSALPKQHCSMSCVHVVTCESWHKLCRCVGCATCIRQDVSAKAEQPFLFIL